MYYKYAWDVQLKDKKRVLQLLMLLKRIRMSLIANQTIYGWIKEIDFTVDQ